MANATENRALEAPHKLTLDARRRLSMTGVVEVESFDEAQVVLATTKGTLIVRGRGSSADALAGRRAGHGGRRRGFAGL